MYWQDHPRKLFDTQIIVLRKKNWIEVFMIIVEMELWVVAAAAGAGYLAKNLQNLPSSEKQRLVNLSPRFSTHRSLESRNFLQKIRDRSCPLRRLAQENRIKDTSDEQKDGGDYDVPWLPSFPPGFSGKHSIIHLKDFVDNADCSSFEFGKFRLLKNKASGYFVKPLSSLQSGLVSQLHEEQEEVEEYIHSSVPTPWISTMITEETENISRSSSDSSLPGKASHSPGSPNSMFFLIIGITIGIIATIIADGNEITSLNDQLKQANSFVQDLQEELEMKEKLTVKDLADEESLSFTKNNTSVCNQELIPSFPEPESDKHAASENEIEAGYHLLSSEIEAELEAELERLELNMKSSVMDIKSGFSQLDQGFEAFTASERMKLNLFSRQYNDDSSEPDYEEESGNCTEQNIPPNYAVSPRELTIRLHEVIESRLEAHIRELETALRNSQNRLQFLETECNFSQDVETECIVSQYMASTPESLASTYK